VKCCSILTIVYYYVNHKCLLNTTVVFLKCLQGFPRFSVAKYCSRKRPPKTGHPATRSPYNCSLMCIIPWWLQIIITGGSTQPPTIFTQTSIFRFVPRDRELCIGTFRTKKNLSHQNTSILCRYLYYTTKVPITIRRLAISYYFRLNSRRREKGQENENTEIWFNVMSSYGMNIDDMTDHNIFISSRSSVRIMMS